MQARRALAQEFLALLRSVFHAELRDCPIIVAASLQFLQQRLRHRRPAQRDEPLDLGRTENRQDPGTIGTVTPRFARNSRHSK